MSTEKVIENLNLVRQEAMAMLENVKAVRGDRFARGLQSMLVATQLADINNILIQMVDADDKLKAVACSSGIATCVCQLMENLFIASAFTDEETKELIEMHERMHDSVHDLIKTAIERGDKGFGNAH